MGKILRGIEMVNLFRIRLSLRLCCLNSTYLKQIIYDETIVCLKKYLVAIVVSTDQLNYI